MPQHAGLRRAQSDPSTGSGRTGVFCHLLVLLTALLLAACTTPALAPKPPAPPPISGPISVPGAFADNPIVYFAITDRFANGNSANDHAYGRQREADPAADIATFHGGDLKGITDKLNEGWFRELGVNAIWITAPYEQIHGWVVGGDKAFKHYAYHGYYALDYTVLDLAMGTPDELREMVATAHRQGIRILFDVVMNHPGYLDLQTARELNLKVLWPGSERATLRDYHGFIDYNSFNFADWWGRSWVRAGLPGYLDGGRDDLTMQLAYLPDFRTESTGRVKLPTFLRTKPGTRARDLPDATVRDYLVIWLSDWVREYGIDGFRADTVKHVEPEAWAALKRSATAALADWKARHPADKIDDQPFWMVGEYWGQGPERSPLIDSGFDALINFEFQDQVPQFAQPDALYSRYASLLSGRPGYNALSYVSSHDTRLFDRSRLVQAGAALMLAPGAVQVFYGDETARPPGPAPASDPQQATRSDMNWATLDTTQLAHWRRLGSFRARHVALARGVHRQLSASPYVFSRVDAATGDAVVVAMAVDGTVTLPLGGTFGNGEALRDAYSGQRVEVVDGRVTLAASRYVLLERAPAATLAATPAPALPLLSPP
ncbi:alpha-amylase family glycosyl hydrolase [Rhizobacter sp. OV335]|uniref:alpha-amylase family glycosyl hydrolase n=1 Tax=Rhizobacter sp. OV335 TaxID=1500264 RepID=UPI001F1CCDB3|nr:alpha-amylase family glycosyl hydrolase [Rhizobacter sp. OV335]